MSDLSDFLGGTSPGFGRLRQGQVVTINGQIDPVFGWSGIIAPGASATNTFPVAAGVLFQIDSVQLWTDAKGPQRYAIEVEFLAAPGTWLVYYYGIYESDAVVRIQHVMGSWLAGVSQWREIVYNDNYVDRNFICIRTVVTNEA